MDEKALLKAAQALAKPEERLAYLDAMCAGDAALRERIDRALRSPAGERASLSSQRISRAETAPSMTALPMSEPPAAAAAPSGDIPEEFGRYRILRLLGRGGMGAVYLAKDSLLDREVALKIPTLNDSDDRAEVVERFYREARAAGNLHHPNICQVYDVGTIDDRIYLTMRYVEGRPLTKFISRDKPQNPRNVAVVVRKLASALAEAHRAGVVHRDLKPANVMMDGKSEPVVMDFGLARQIDGKKDLQLTQTGMIVGTPAYMSPEQINGDPATIGAPTDIWSLGVILYELLTARLPYEGNVLQVIGAIQHTDPPPLTSLRADTPPKLEAICRKMLSRDIARRYQSMDEVIADLTAFLKNPRGGTEGSDAALSTIPSHRLAAATPPDDEPSEFDAPFATGAQEYPLTLAATMAPPLPPKSGPRGGRRNRRKPARPGWIVPVGGAIALLALVVGAAQFFPGSDEVPLMVRRDASLASENVSLILDARRHSLSTGELTIPLKPGRHDLEIQRGAERYQAGAFDLAPGEEPLLAISLDNGKVIASKSAGAAPPLSLALQQLPDDAPPPRIDPKPSTTETDSTTAASNGGVSEGSVAGDAWDNNALRMKFRWCPPGNFIMGSPENEPDRQSQPDEGNEDQVPVALTRGFWIGQYEVTQYEWRQIMGTTLSQQRDRFIASLPLYGEGPNYPIYYVNHTDATEFCRKFTAQERAAGRLPADWEYRLPTEAQWEYACRAGTTTATAFGIRLSSRQANFSGDSPYNFGAKGPYLKQAAEVGLYPANDWGLHDMHGNVWELCRDAFRDRLTGGRDPEVTVETGKWAHRGGGWRGSGRRNRSATRAGVTGAEVSFDLGLRVALVKTAP